MAADGAGADGEILQMQEGVRAWVTRAARQGERRLRGASPLILLSLLCAGAFSPLLNIGAGGVTAASAGIGILSGVGGGVLTGVITDAVDRLRQRGKEAPSRTEVEDEIARQIQAVLEAGDANAQTLRAEIAAVLKEIDAGGTALREAFESGNEQLRHDVVAAVGEISAGFGELQFLLGDILGAATAIQESQDAQNAQLRVIVDRIGWVATEARLTREEAAAWRATSREPAGGAAAGRAPQWTRGNPYRGLLPFEETDAELFYGRERLTAELVGKLAGHLTGPGPVIVTGASGAGKSSLLRAGLLPALTRGLQLPASAHWPRLVLSPTAHPLGELAAQLAALGGTSAGATALRRELARDPSETHLAVRQILLAEAARRAGTQPPPGDTTRRLVLIVDQFEQVFTLNADGAADAERQAFIAALCAAAGGAGPDREPSALVLIAVRGDFVDRCAAHPDLAAALQRGPFVVGPMTESDLRLAITGPADTAGLQLEPGLADAILGDLRATGGGGSAGVLPLLSQAMSLTWDRREGNRLTSHGYSLTGGVRHAVQTTADSVYDTLPAGQQALARELLRSMTAVSRDGRLARRPVTRADLYATRPAGGRAQVDAVLDAFAARRLVVLDDQIAQIAHDALLAAWPRLRTWLEDDQASWILHSQLSDDASSWHDTGSDPSFLYRGTHLSAVRQAASTWAANPARYPALTHTQSEFLRASELAAARSSRVRRIVTTALVVLLVTAVTGAGLATLAQRSANQQRATAVSAQLAAESQTLAGADPQTAAQLAAAAWRVSKTPQARDSMLDLLTLPQRGVLKGSGPQGLANTAAIAFGRGGRILATGNGDVAMLWNTATRTQIGKPMSFGGPGNPVTAVAFSPDGKILASDDGGAVFLWNVATHRRMGSRLVYYGHPTASLAFSPDGTMLATITDDGYAQLWNVASHAPLGATFQTGGHMIVFGPGGKTFITYGGGTVQRWGTATRQPIGAPLILRGVSVSALSPDGSILATGDSTGQIQLWDLATGRSAGGPLAVSGSPIDAMAFSPDGKTLAVGDESGTVRCWDVVSRTLSAGPLSVGVIVSALAFSPDSRTLVSASDKGPPRFWDLRIWQPAGPTLSIGSVYTAAFGQGAPMLATVDEHFTTRLWDMAAGRPDGGPLNAGSADALAFSTDGRTLATATDYGDVQLWKSATRTKEGASWNAGSVHLIVFSPDGRLLVTAGGPARLWRRATRTSAGPPLGTDIRDAAFSPDGKTLATTTGGTGAVRLWNLAAHPPAGVSLAGSTGDEVAFSPDGKFLVTGSLSGTTQLWNTATRSPAGAPFNAGHVTAVAFSPDSRLLATGNDAGDIQLWDTATLAPIGPPLNVGVTGGEYALAFGANGTTIAAVTGRAAQVWDISFPRNLISAVCAIAGRPLTRQAWDYYISSEPFQRVCSGG